MFWSLVDRFIRLHDYDHVRALRELPSLPEASRMSTRPLLAGHPTRHRWLTTWLIRCSLAHRWADMSGARYD